MVLVDDDNDNCNNDDDDDDDDDDNFSYNDGDDESEDDPYYDIPQSKAGLFDSILSTKGNEFAIETSNVKSSNTFLLSLSLFSGQAHRP